MSPDRENSRNYFQDEKKTEFNFPKCIYSFNILSSLSAVAFPFSVPAFLPKYSFEIEIMITLAKGFGRFMNFSDYTCASNKKKMKMQTRK